MRPMVYGVISEILIVGVRSICVKAKAAKAAKAAEPATAAQDDAMCCVSAIVNLFAVPIPNG